MSIVLVVLLVSIRSVNDWVYDVNEYVNICGRISSQAVGFQILSRDRRVFAVTRLLGGPLTRKESADIPTGSEVRWSGRRDSNPRHPAWKAGTLPLSYSRKTESILPQTLQLVNKQSLLCS
jgi:hypothetical protein